MVFTRPSDKETLVLTITPPADALEPEILGRAVAKGGLVGKTVWVDWPHLTEALVVAVSSPQCRWGERGAVNK
jgi:hypothetical protein